MIKYNDTIAGGLLFFVSGLALIFLAHTEMQTASPTTSKALETIGIAMAGYAPVKLVISIKTRLSQGWKTTLIDRVFRSTVSIISLKKDLPLLIMADVEGCVTPPHRTEIDLRNFQRLRGYCEFVKSDAGQDFPPIVFYTGRSQGYMELLAQSLGMINKSLDLPFVIENGTALYFPASKKTIPLITSEQWKMMRDTFSLLKQKFPQNEFEPKTYMITINHIPNRQTIDDLRQEVILILREADMLKFLTVDSTASAVDITPKETNKLSGLQETLKVYHSLRPDRQDQGLDDVVGIADSTSDLCVIEKVGTAYCPAHAVHPEVRRFIEKHFGADHVIDQKNIDFVIAVIEKECGLRLI